MLVLTRRLGETLCIGDNIRVTVLGVQGKQVKLGLDVPKDMIVYREEVYKRVQEENKRSILSNNADVLMVTALWNKTHKK